MKIKVQNLDQNKRMSYVFYINFPLIYIMSRVEGKFELQLMRGYEEQFRGRLGKKVSLSYDCLPLNVEEYQSRVSQVLQEMKIINPTEKDLSLHDQIILGKIEGQLGATNFKQIIQSVVGEVADEKIKLYLKQKSQQRTYGLNGKDKMSIVRQVKKLQPLKKYFNLQQINKKRKFNRLYSSALKNLAKYFELYDKIDPANVDTINAAFQQYTNYTKEEKKFNNFVKQFETVEMKTVIEQPLPSTEEKIFVDEIQNVQIQEQHKIDQQIVIEPVDSKGKQSPSKNQKKQNDEKDHPTAKKKSKSKKSQPKPQQLPVQQPNSGQVTEKQKIQTDDKQTKSDKQKQKTQKKQKKQETVKKPNPNNRSITDFFAVKKKDPAQQTLLSFKTLSSEEIKKQVQGEGDQQQQIKVKNVAQDVGVKNSVWQKFSQKGQQEQQRKEKDVQTQQIEASLSQLRSQYRSLRMQSEQYNPLAYYTNIIITLSTLEYFDYFMAPTSIVIDFSKPFQKIEEVFYYEDESEQFEGQSANQEQQEQDENQQGSMLSQNNTILSDDHLSNEQLSSCEPYEINLKVEYGKATKWIYGQANRIQSQQQIANIINAFSMICLQDHMPLILQEQEDNSDKIVITCEMWRDVYKMAQGFYGTKQSIIKDISNILSGVSKTWIDTMLKQRSQKVLNQRFIKKQFIEDIKQKVPDIQQILQAVLNERNQELKKQKAEKNYQKDQKLQKDILQCTGSRYIVNLLKQLKQKGYKQLRKNQLIEFVNQRKGEQWDKIKQEINTMSRPIVQMLKVMNHGEDKIDEQVMVDDEEYNKGTNEQETDKKIKQKVQMQKKIKSSLKQKELKQKVKKRRQNNQNTLQSIYQKTKPISRARKTKNSLKTGILSIDELKKQKQQEEKNIEEEEKNEQQQENDNQGEQSQREIIEMQQNNDQKRIKIINDLDKVDDDLKKEVKAIQNIESIVVQCSKLSNEQEQVKKNNKQQAEENDKQEMCTQQKEEIKQSSDSIVNPQKSNHTVAIVDNGQPKYC